MPRLFYALDLDARSREALAGTLRRLAFDPPAGVRVLPVDSVHLTLKFLGEADEALVARLADGLALARPLGPLPTKGLTGYPRAARAHVGVLELADPDGALADVAQALGVHARALGFAADERPFRAHVTLARAREGRDLRAWFARVEPPPSIAFEAVVLYESKTLSTGPVYTARARRT